MFKRREKQPFFKKLRNWIWPETGLMRTFYYHRHRIARIPDTPYRIAAGFAVGAAVSFTPFIGFHILIGLLISFLIRANYLASAIGTIVGNPWTFPFIWVLIYDMGMWILGLPNEGDFLDKIDQTLLLSNPLKAVYPIILPMFVGGIPISIMVFWATYWPMKTIIIHYRDRKQKRKQNRREQRLKEFDKIITEDDPPEELKDE